MKKLALVLAALLVLSSVPALAVDWNETGLPIVNEPYTFSIFYTANPLRPRASAPLR